MKVQEQALFEKGDIKITTNRFLAGGKENQVEMVKDHSVKDRPKKSDGGSWVLILVGLGAALLCVPYGIGETSEEAPYAWLLAVGGGLPGILLVLLGVWLMKINKHTKTLQVTFTQAPKKIEVKSEDLDMIGKASLALMTALYYRDMELPIKVEEDPFTREKRHIFDTQHQTNNKLYPLMRHAWPLGVHPQEAAAARHIAMVPCVTEASGGLAHGLVISYTGPNLNLDKEGSLWLRVDDESLSLNPVGVQCNNRRTKTITETATYAVDVALLEKLRSANKTLVRLDGKKLTIDCEMLPYFSDAMVIWLDYLDEKGLR